MNGKQENRLDRVEKMTLRMSVIQTTIAVTGFFVAIIALYAALNEADAVRKQQQASVWPHLEFQRSFRGVSGSERLDINLRNSGIGPAKIELIEFFLDGAALRNWDEALGPFTGADANTYSHIGVSGRVMRPDDEFAILSLIASEIDPQSIIAIRDAVDQGRLAGRICYCSVFEECWLLVSETREPEPVRRCPEPARENTF